MAETPHQPVRYALMRSHDPDGYDVLEVTGHGRVDAAPMLFMRRVQWVEDFQAFLAWVRQQKEQA